MTEPTPEGVSRESIESAPSKESVIQSLRQNPEDIALLNAYIENRQKQIQAPYISREDTEQRTFAFIVELAEIYRDSGLIEEAADAYNDAADFAEANGMETELAAILAELAKI
jgi:hypothetical protein